MKTYQKLFIIAFAGSSIICAIPKHSFAAESCDVSSVSSGTETLLANGTPAALANVSPYWTADIEGASWIWESAKPSAPQEDQTVAFHQDFTVDEETDSATLVIAADDLYNVQVNGVQIASIDEHDTFMAVGTYDITDALVSGTNTITVMATNLSYGRNANAEQNPAGLRFRIDLNQCDGSSHSHHSSSHSSGGSVAGASTTTVSTTGTSTLSSIPGTVSSTIASGFSSLFGGVARANAEALASITASGTASTSSSTAAASTGLLAGVGAAMGLMPFYGWIALLLLLIALAVFVSDRLRRASRS